MTGILQGTPGTNSGSGAGAKLTSLFYAGDVATDGAHWIARSLGLAPVGCDNQNVVQTLGNISVTVNSVQHTLQVNPSPVGGPVIYPAEGLAAASLSQHSLVSAAQSSSISSQASSTFDFGYYAASNSCQMDGTVQCTSTGLFVPGGSPAIADSAAYALIGPGAGPPGQLSFDVDTAAVVLNFSIYDNHQGVGAHGRFDLHVIRTDVNPPVEFAYWGVDPNESANALNPNLPNNGAIVLPPGSYSIAFGIGVQTNTQDAGPPMSGQLSTYSENRIATATFQFVTAETVPPPIQGTAGKIPETGYDATLLTTYSTTLFYDLMTLCSPRWVSPQTYEMLLGQGLALMGQ